MLPDSASEANGGRPQVASHDGLTKFWTDIQTVPNMLSLSRIAAILVTAWLYLAGYRVPGLLLGIAAGLTDIFDGWLARKLNQSTELGAILDRLSDLIMETVALTCCLYYALLPPIFLVLYLCREWMVVSARLYVAERNRSIPSSFWGKRKTNLVMASFIGLFAAHSGLISGDGNEIVYKIGYSMMIGGLVASYLSGAIYMRSFAQIYSESESKR